MGPHGDREAPWSWVQFGPQGRHAGPDYLALRGHLRGHAISLRGFKLVRVWFVFPEQRIKVPNSWELGPSAGDVHDDGNDVDTDDCLSTCVPAKCGDGVVQGGVETCDDGNADNDDQCTDTCVPASCGDGFPQPGEECDDGNVVYMAQFGACCSNSIFYVS